MAIPFPKPDGAHTHAFMYDPSASLIGFPKNRLKSDHKLEFPFPNKFDSSDPLKLIEQCKDNKNCPVTEVLKYGSASSGHFGHAGRPGQVGGSKPSGRAVSGSAPGGEGDPGSPSFVGPPSPFASGGGGGSLSVDRSLRNIGDNIVSPDSITGATFTTGGTGDSEIDSELDDAIENPALPAEAKSTLELIKDIGLSTVKGLIGPIKNFIRNFNKEVLGRDAAPEEIEEKAQVEVNKFKQEVEKVTHEEVLKNVRRSLLAQFKTFVDPELMSIVADQVLNGEVKLRAIDIRQAFLGAKEAQKKETKRATKEEKETLKAAKEAIKEAAKQEKAAAKAIEKEEKAVAKSAKERKRAEEKAAKAIKKAEEKEKKEIEKAEEAEIARREKIPTRRFFRSTPEAPSIEDVIDDIESGEIPTDEVADRVNSALSASSGSDREEAIEQLRSAGIVSASGGAGGVGQDVITNKGTIPPVEIAPEGAIDTKEECQAMIAEAMDAGTIEPDANISEIITELRDDCPFDNIADFINSLLEDSNAREEDIETLIDDGFANRNDAGEVFITDNNSIEPVKIEENLTKNGEINNEIDIYKLAESCPTTQNNGCPLFLSAFAENTSKDIGWKEIFEFDDESILDIIISNFHKLKDTLNPPIKLGHDEEQALVQNSGFPSAGWITDVKRKAATNKLLAYFSNVPEAIIRLIESGAYKRLSTELYNNYIDPQTKEAFGPTIRAVSILGADVPRIKTLDDLTVIYHSDNLPYKILTEERNMNLIKKLGETIKGLKVDVKEVLKLQDITEESPIVKSLRVRIAELEDELETLKSQKKGGREVRELDEAGNPINADIQLSEKVKSQEEMITKLSDSVKTIGSELKSANEHILGSKKDSFRASKGKVFTPAFVDKAMEMINFAEDENKLVELIDHMAKLNKESALFLDEGLVELDELIENPTEFKNSQDKLHNDVTALSEKDKITYNEAFDRLMLLKGAKGK
ncbi:MAG TPA: hypothetical protein ENI23_07685 [bacterium]|nr:hypothetical protein [bacterium]